MLAGFIVFAGAVVVVAGFALAAGAVVVLAGFMFDELAGAMFEVFDGTVVVLVVVEFVVVVFVVVVVFAAGLLAVLLVAASPQAIPIEAKAKSDAVAMIFFIVL